MLKWFESRRRWSRVGLLFVLSLLTLAHTARAGGLVVQFQIGANAPLAIADNGRDDAEPMVGIIRYSGPLSGFTISVVIGQSKPLLGDSATSTIDLQASVSGGTNVPFTIQLSDTDFPGPFNGAGTLLSTVGGNAQGVVATFQGFIDSSNTLFGT